ncbi:MAG: hypothetical protein RKO24_02990 [Candidatus Competibacter sp.]|nr:hypothetical protein [Candidatus Competibacter sp.]
MMVMVRGTISITGVGCRTGETRSDHRGNQDGAIKEKKGWLFQSLHFSNLTGDDLSPQEDDEQPAERKKSAETTASAPKTQ